VTVKTKVNVKFDLNRFRRELKKAMPDIINDSAHIVILDIAYGIRTRRDIEGGTIRRLRASTVYSKREKGSISPSTPLVDSGEMTKLPPPIKATASKLKAIIRTGKRRKKVAGYHQFGTSATEIVAGAGKVLPIRTQQGRLIFRKRARHPGLASRKWFGISDRAYKIMKDRRYKKMAAILRRIWV